ncbi:hypothetical protein L9F63_022267, partial [Diploptera punctata]
LVHSRLSAQQINYLVHILILLLSRLSIFFLFRNHFLNCHLFMVFLIFFSPKLLNPK